MYLDWYSTFVYSSIALCFNDFFFFFFKQKTAYEMRISDWSSDVCSSDLPPVSIVNRYRAWDAAAVLHLKALHVIFCYRFRGGMIREIQIKVIDLLAKQH